MSLERHWFVSLCRSRAHMGIKVPPFRWRYLLQRWGWRCYVWYPLRRKLWKSEE